MYTILDLMGAVAWRLSGKKVVIRYAWHDDAYGVTWRDEDDRLRIDIRPYLEDQFELSVLLHEIAHCKHHNFIKCSESVMRSDQGDHGSYGYRIIEHQANNQSEIWLNYGLRHRHNDLPMREGVLLSLLGYKDGEL